MATTFGPQTNLAALGALSGLGSATNSLSKTLARIAAARRITKASDDIAGLAVGETLSAQGRSLSQAMRNTNDGIGLVQTADAASGEVGGLLTRMRELAVQSSSGTLSDFQRAYIQDEFDALSSEIDRIAGSTSYLDATLTDGSQASTTLQVGTDGAAHSQVDVALGDLTTGTLGLSSTSVATQSDAESAIDDIDAAINTVSSYRGSYGASLSSLESSLRQSASYHLSLASAESTILDADLALESVLLARDQIRTSTGVAVQVQANRFTAVASSLI